MSTSPSSPISGVPLEVLLDIIHKSLSFPLDEAGRREFQALRSVNSRWRTLCFSDPQLWSSVDVTVKGGAEGQGPGNRSYGTRLKNWFNRAGSLPLRLYFYADVRVRRFHETRGEKIVDCIRSFLDRWEVLQFDTRYGWLEKVWSEEARSGLTTGTWSSLQRLGIPLLAATPGIQSIYGVVEPFPPLSRMPFLQRLGLTVGRLMRPIPITAFGHPGLRELSLTMRDFTPQAMALMQNFPNIHTVLVSVDAVSQLSLIEMCPSLTLNRITTLQLRAEPKELLDVLQRFRCPNLQGFSVTVNDRVNPDYHISEKIIPFIDTHRNTLTTLRITSGTPGFVDAEYQAILSSPSSSCIQHLQLDAWPYAEETPDAILPKLRTITIGQFGRHRAQDLYYAEHANSLLAFAERRQELKTLEVHDPASAEIAEGITTISMLVHWYMLKFPRERAEAVRARGVNVVILEDALKYPEY